MAFHSLVKAWLWVSAFASVAGWLLSALGQLNVPGYLILSALTAAVVLVFRLAPTDVGGYAFLNRGELRRSWRKLRRRLRRGLPLAFAMLSLLIFAGGVWYAPNNHTALTYRIPRVLHWLGQEQWHWIHAPDARMNDRACGIEWLSAPLVLLTKSDRGLFLLNFIPFLLLPGLVFRVWTQLGIRSRVAWHWMWLVPTSYGFLLQAGSTGNDTFPTIYALAALDFAFRARDSGRVSDLWYSLLAAALLTGAKASNLPLLLPWAMVAFRLLPLIKKGLLLTVCVAVVAGCVSFLPNAVLNMIYCGDWSGAKLESAGMVMKNPLVGIWGNGFLLVLKNFVPPLFPMAGWWNQSGLSVLPRVISAPLVANFEQGFHNVGEIPMEETAGAGFGLSVLVLASCLASFARQASPAGGKLNLNRLLLLVAPWISLIVYCGKIGMVDAARLVAPYYPLLFPLLLARSRQSEIVRQRWWKAMVWMVLLLAFMVLVIAPTRPLWPARSILTRLAERHPGSRPLARALSVYTVLGSRFDPLADVRALVPPGVMVVGFMGSEDDIETSLWRPYSQRRVEDILLTDSAQRIREQKLEYVVVGGFNLKLHQTTLEDWLRRTGGQLIATTNATLKVAEGPQPWYVVRFPTP